MTTALVLSGGGSLGAVQVGMLQALTARGVEPDLLIGTSVGALNAAYVAGHGATASSLDGLAAIWTRLRRRDVFPLQPARLSAAVLGWTPSLCPNGALRRLVREHVGFARLEDSAIPLHVVATDVASGEEVLLSDGDAVDAVLASAAIPAELVDVRVLPPLCPLSVSSTDFRHGAHLIDRARTAAGHWLDEGGPLLAHPERFLSLHRHHVATDADPPLGGEGRRLPTRSGTSS